MGRPDANPTPPPADSRPLAPLSEEQLARLWQRRAARQQSFRSEDGRQIRVLYPGRPGVTAGPDFRDALLLVEGSGLVQGDVEIHLRQRDWNAHGHQHDPNYNGVALHVALDPDPQPSRTDGGGAPPVVNPAALLRQSPDAGETEDDGEIEVAGDAKDADDLRARLWRILAGHGYRPPGTPDELRAVLNRAGDQRFLAHSRRFRLLLSAQPAEQTLWESLCEALGYRNNRHPFLLLARVAPFGLLAAEARITPDAQRAGALADRLRQLAGFEAGPVPEGFGPPLEAGAWRLFRVRPSNHPRRRMLGAAALVSRYCGHGLINGLATAASAGHPATLTRSLAVASDDAGPAPIGPQRARDLAINVALPFLHAWWDAAGDAAASAAALELYRNYGRLADNEITRELAASLQEPAWGRVADNARRQQGLLHLQRLLAGASAG